ncbi:low molecular weight protein-tyrosine-phosphatase [Paraburkholderia sartisoli]|uniref:protein-tyrosine-phosphatase n=1 Tax=Paraburkholderia sartisoli TaxID=83784 RepID=A0A1H4HSZ6_9BURK|nr:low molecular weight protein-tyrosine-phosphatase [Paraburkholderia sartisoli]SEB24954.1 protein tyrosine phosphatase [Paraburkholderia sartisoli]
MRPAILVVCLANVCRSPMAQGLLGQCFPAVDVSSAGIHGIEGHPADPFAYDVMLARGVDIASHRARRLDVTQCLRADLILVMERAQRLHIERCFPAARGRVFNLGLFPHAGYESGHFDIPDPSGGPYRAFEQCADLIAHGIEAWEHRIRSLLACPDRIVH